MFIDSVLALQRQQFHFLPCAQQPQFALYLLALATSTPARRHQRLLTACRISSVQQCTCAAATAQPQLQRCLRRHGSNATPSLTATARGQDDFGVSLGSAVMQSCHGQHNSSSSAAMAAVASLAMTGYRAHQPQRQQLSARVSIFISTFGRTAL